jgi:hypothetical protein
MPGNGTNSPFVGYHPNQMKEKLFLLAERPEMACTQSLNCAIIE